MPDIVSDGLTRVAWVTTIANIALPTVTELNLGTLLHDTMTADGFNGFNPATAVVPTSKFSAIFDVGQPGRISFSGPMLRFFKQSGSDPIFTLLFPRLVNGNVVVRRSLAAATGWITAQAIEVYPMTTLQGSKVNPGPNMAELWECPLVPSASPNFQAAVA